MCLLWRFSAQFTQWHCNGCILLYLLIFLLYTFQSNSYLKFRFYLLVGTDTCWQMVFQQDSLLPWSLVCCLRRLLFSLGQWTMHCGYLEEKNTSDCWLVCVSLILFCYCTIIIHIFWENAIHVLIFTDHQIRSIFYGSNSNYSIACSSTNLLIQCYFVFLCE